MIAVRARRLALLSFPAHFRSRYGEELQAVSAECGPGWRVTADLFLAAAREWLRPSFSGPAEERRRRRLEATTGTVFVLWSLAALATAAFARAVDDRPVPGLRSWGRTAYVAGSVAFDLGAALVVVAGFGYWLRVVLPAWRDRDRSRLVPAVLPGLVALGWLGLSGVLVVAVRVFVAGSRRPLAAAAGGPAPRAEIALVLYGVLTLACVCAAAGAAARALTRAQLPVRLLTGSAVVAVVVTGTLVAMTAAACVCLARVFMVGSIGVWDTVLAVGPVAVLVITTAAALTSSLRGTRALVAS